MIELSHMYRQLSLIVTCITGIACTEVRHVEVDEDRGNESLEQIAAIATVSIALPEGSFQMGNNALIDESPIHEVVLTQPFQAMKTEVTQSLYEAVTGENPSFFQRCGGDCPVEKVRWIEAIQFSNRVNELLGLEQCYVIGVHGAVDWVNGLQCKGWRLPTEAEWEWMAHSDHTDPHLLLNDVAWFKGNAKHQTHPACEKQSNAHGLCDILGNVQEWVWDVVERYPDESITDPLGGTAGSHRVFRGGAWNRYAENVVATKRKDAAYLFRNNDLGFRLVQSIDSDK